MAEGGGTVQVCVELIGNTLVNTGLVFVRTQDGSAIGDQTIDLCESPQVFVLLTD